MSEQKIIDIMHEWLSAFSDDTSQSICSLYDEHASLWGTLSPIKRNSTVLIRDYFEQIFSYSNRTAELVDSNIRVFGDMAICNGVYRLNWLNEGLKVAKIARFSFVYINKNERWFIIEHHSSFMP